MVGGVNWWGDVGYVVEWGLYVEKVVDVEVEGMGVVVGELGGYEEGMMEGGVGVLERGVEVVEGVVGVVGGR